uniref:Uncharacterized protein n=1 Tax=Anopheles farauti TaxID=69004 RepID=A0A182QQ01_9DIPT
MRLTVLICLYLTFLEASVGSLIYPERTLIQMLLGQGRMVSVEELIGAGSSPDQLRTEPSITGASPSVNRKLLADGEVIGEMATAGTGAALRKTKRKLATKKAVKRLVNSRASVRPKGEQMRPTVERKRTYGTMGDASSGEPGGDRSNGEQQQLRRLTSVAFRRSRPRERRSADSEEMERPNDGVELMDVLRLGILYDGMISLRGISRLLFTFTITFGRVVDWGLEPELRGTCNELIDVEAGLEGFRYI